MVTRHITATKSDEWNQAIRNIELTTQGGGRKVIPYLGMFWRDVDWAGRIELDFDPIDGACFDESGKWDYPRRQLTDAERTRLLDMIERLVVTGSFAASSAICQFMRELPQDNAQ